MTGAVFLLAGAMAAVGGLVWLDRMIESDRVGVQLILVIAAVDVAFDIPRPEIGGLAVDHLDVLLVVMIASLIARLLRGWRPSPMVLAVIGIFLLVTFSIARGANLFEPAAAINEARETMYLFAAIMYTSFLRVDRVTREDVAKIWLMFCTALLAIAAIRWFIVLSGLPLLGEWYSPDYWGLRVITSGKALSLAHGSLILLPPILRGEATKSQFRLAVAFGVAVIVLQHRSVYALYLVGAATMVWRHKAVLSRRFVMAMIASSVVAAAAFVTVFDSGELAGQASTADASSTVTFEWRAAGWVTLLRDSAPDGPEEVLFGTPYGAGYERILPTGERVDVAPHNHYLEMLLRIGIVGLFLMLLVGFGTWSRLRTVMPRRGDPLLSDSTLAALFVTYMLYMIPYNIVMETGILIGLSISAHQMLPRGGAHASIVGDRGLSVYEPPPVKQQ